MLTYASSLDIIHLTCTYIGPLTVPFVDWVVKLLQFSQVIRCQSAYSKHQAKHSTHRPYGHGQSAV